MTSSVYNQRLYLFIALITACYTSASHAAGPAAQGIDELPEVPFSEIPLPPDHLRRDDPMPMHRQREIGMVPTLKPTDSKNYYVNSKKEASRDVFSTDSILASVELGIRHSGGEIAYVMPQTDFYSFALSFDAVGREVAGTSFNLFGPGLSGELHYNFRNVTIPFAGAGMAFQHWRASTTSDEELQQQSGGTMILHAQYGIRFVLTPTFSLIFREKTVTYPPRSRPEYLALAVQKGGSLRDQQVLFAFNLGAG